MHTPKTPRRYELTQEMFEGKLQTHLEIQSPVWTGDQSMKIVQSSWMGTEYCVFLPEKDSKSFYPPATPQPPEKWLVDSPKL